MCIRDRGERVKLRGIFIFLNKGGEAIDTVPAIKLDFREDILIKESIAVFNDEDPCIIHRTFCRNKLGLALLSTLEGKYSARTFSVESLPEEVRGRIVLPPGTDFVRIE